MSKVIDTAEETVLSWEGHAVVKLTEHYDSGGEGRRFILRRPGHPDKPTTRSEGVRWITSLSQGDLFGGDA